MGDKLRRFFALILMILRCLTRWDVKAGQTSNGAPKSCAKLRRALATFMYLPDLEEAAQKVQKGRTQLLIISSRANY